MWSSYLQLHFAELPPGQRHLAEQDSQDQDSSDHFHGLRHHPVQCQYRHHWESRPYPQEELLHLQEGSGHRRKAVLYELALQTRPLTLQT